MAKNSGASLFSQVLAVGLVLIAGYGVWKILSGFITFLSAANPSVSAAIVGSMATVLVGVGGALYTQSQIKKREIEDAHRAKKVEIYKNYLDMITRMLAKDNPNLTLAPPTQEELVNFLAGFKTDIVLWGSSKVINAQLDFQKASTQDGDVLHSVDSLYKAIRHDIGLSNRGLDNNQLIKMYLSNPDEMDKSSVESIALQQNEVSHDT